MLWTTQGFDDMKNLGLWAQGSRFYEQVKVVDNTNNSQSQGLGSKWNEQLRADVDMKDSELWAHGSKCYEQI